jgi:2-hydroxychromene-2-carboxylate isomerase
MSKHIEWSFDFISPFAYLQSTQLPRFSRYAALELRPVLFAGLLKAWGTKGPAELPSKRQITYETVAWQAQQHQIALQFPATHPFNPLPLLRLCLVKGCTLSVVQRLFEYVWAQGHLPLQAGPWEALLNELQVSADALNDPAIKAALSTNTQQAIDQGVFGVPSARCWQGGSSDVKLFWGFDATGLIDAWCQDDPVFQSAQWLAAAQVGAGVQRNL